jgi:DNA mismatch repair protein PMS2
VSNVSEDFRDRLATYALDSPDRLHALDASLTPMPEVSITQSSPTRRNSGHPAQEFDDEISDDDDNVIQPERSVSRGKRTLTTIITPSQMEAIIGPSKRPRIDVSAEVTPSRGVMLQTSIREHFLRKANHSEVRGKPRDNEMLDILAPDQVTSMLAAVDDDESPGELDRSHDDEERGNKDHANDEDDEEENDIGMDEIDDEAIGPSNSAQVEEVENDVPEQTSHEVAPELVQVEVPTTLKSKRNLLKSRPKNPVHNLRTIHQVSINDIRSQYSSLRQTRTPLSRRGLPTGKEYAVSNEKAEERLSLTVSKEDFARMRIVGQFNLGFIIAVRERQDDGGDTVEDVFIIDQHASDEKYNFERLQAETIMQVQTLARYVLASN